MDQTQLHIMIRFNVKHICFTLQFRQAFTFIATKETLMIQCNSLTYTVKKIPKTGYIYL